jgi:hypothetical protein
MELSWLDKPDNPGMADWALSSEDVYGAIVLVNFHEQAYKAALTADLATWLPVLESRQLAELDWLDPSRATRPQAAAGSPRGARGGPSRPRAPA